VVDQLVDLNVEYLTLSGGEPFVWSPWRELVAHIRNKGKALSIISNGYRIREDDVTYLKDVGLTNIALSVDGMRESHNTIRRADDAFDSTVATNGLFRKAGLPVLVSTSVNQINFKDLEALKVCLEDNGVNLWQVQLVNSFGRAGEMKDSLIVTHEQYVQLVEFIKWGQDQYNSGHSKLRVMPADSVGYCHGISAEVWGDLEWQGCSAGKYVLGVQSDGRVVGCLSLQDDQFVAGNCLEKPLAEIWADDEAFAYNRKFDASQLTGACKGCSAGEQCRGGCLGMGYSSSGELHNNSYCYKHIKEKM
jgi:radical SAM protein with 4Fe4S-binding SPASM domain